MDKETFEKQEAWKAAATIRIREQEMGAPLTYDEALALGDQAAGFVVDMDPMDPAWMYFSEQRDKMYALADALNRHQELGRTDHFVMTKLLVSYNKGQVTEEMTIPLFKSYANRKGSVVEHAMLSVTRTELIRKGVSIDLFRDLEIVPL